MSFTSATVCELIFSNVGLYTAVTYGSASEASLIGTNRPIIPAGFFDPARGGGKRIKIEASGILSTTGTPTWTFTVGMGTSTTWSSSDSDLGVTAAMTTIASGVSNRYWKLDFDIHCVSVGIGSNGMTLCSSGIIFGPTAFASPFMYDLAPTTPPTATWTTAVWDSAVTYYIGLSAACGSASASNALKVQQLAVYGLN